MVQQQTARETEIVRFMCPGGSTRYASRDHIGWSRQSADRDRQDLEHMPLAVFVGTVLCGFWTKAGLVNSTVKSQVLVSPTGFLSKGYIKERCWEVGKTVDHKDSLESHIRNLNLLALWVAI